MFNSLPSCVHDYFFFFYIFALHETFWGYPTPTITFLMVRLLVLLAQTFRVSRKINSYLHYLKAITLTLTLTIILPILNLCFLSSTQPYQLTVFLNRFSSYE